MTDLLRGWYGLLSQLGAVLAEPLSRWADGSRVPVLTALLFGAIGATDPNTILIDRAGRMVGRVRGERDWRTDDARRLVETLLGSP